VLKDLMTEPVGRTQDGKDVWLGDIWPSSDEIHKLMKYAMNAKALPQELRQGRRPTRASCGAASRAWPATPTTGPSTYIAEPPFFEGFTLDRPGGRRRRAASRVIRDARIMALFGDSITTDHISPAGSIKDTSPAGRWLQEHGVQKPTSTATARAAATTR
jgi:aconitate hydratase